MYNLRCSAAKPRPSLCTGKRVPSTVVCVALRAQRAGRGRGGRLRVRHLWLRIPVLIVNVLANVEYETKKKRQTSPDIND